MFIAFFISRNILVEIINLTICVFSTKRYIHEFTKRIIQGYEYSSEIKGYSSFPTVLRKNVQSLFSAAALQTDQKAKNTFCHSVRVASALNGSITTDCTARCLHSLCSCSIYGEPPPVPNEPKSLKSKGIGFLRLPPGILLLASHCSKQYLSLCIVHSFLFSSL